MGCRLWVQILSHVLVIAVLYVISGLFCYAKAGMDCVSVLHKVFGVLCFILFLLNFFVSSYLPIFIRVVPLSPGQSYACGRPRLGGSFRQPQNTVPCSKPTPEKTHCSPNLNKLIVWLMHIISLATPKSLFSISPLFLSYPVIYPRSTLVSVISTPPSFSGWPPSSRVTAWVSPRDGSSLLSSSPSHRFLSLLSASWQRYIRKYDHFRRNFHHWLHRKLSFGQLSVQPMTKISSKRHVPF